MTRKLWANSHWEVAEDGMNSLNGIEYFIPKDRLCELREGKQGVSMWTLQIAEKTWAPIEPFLEAFSKAHELLKPEGGDQLDMELSASMARRKKKRL